MKNITEGQIGSLKEAENLQELKKALVEILGTVDIALEKVRCEAAGQ